MRHTLGPWNVWAQGNGSDGIVDYNWKLIGHSIHESTKTQAANARLMAAAPDMLEALIEIKELTAYPPTASMGDVFRLARAAVKKAIKGGDE